MVKAPSMQELLEAGVHFGHQVRRGHPKMQEYIFGVRDGIHIINLEESEKLLKEAVEYVHELGKSGKIILFVGTKKQAQPIIKEAAEGCNAPYVTTRWVGGLLTNFDEVRKNIKKLQDLKEKKEKGQLSHYTKKEQLLISRKLAKFDQEYGGVVAMEKLPDVIFLVDCVSDRTALAEAIKVGLPVVSIADTNCNPLLLDYPIPGNDDATKSIKVLTEAIGEAYKAGLGGKKAEVKDEKKEDNKQEVAEGAISDEVAAVEELVEKKTVEDSERVVA